MYFQLGPINSTVPLVQITSSVTCDPGDVIYEGGQFINNTGGDTPQEEYSGPIPSDPRIYTYVVTEDSVYIQAFAWYFDNPPARIP